MNAYPPTFRGSAAAAVVQPHARTGPLNCDSDNGSGIYLPCFRLSSAALTSLLAYGSAMTFSGAKC